MYSMSLFHTYSRFHVLETLSTVKSPVLLLDSEDDSVLQDLVATLFRVVGRGVPQVIENAIFDIAVSIIEDASSVPKFILDILFDHLSMPEVPTSYVCIVSIVVSRA